MTVIAMIPARLGSQRVPKKNIRLLNGKPLIEYAITAAKDAGCFNEIYVNSEADIFGEIAQDLHVSFYKRPAELATSATINDAFAFDFMQHVSSDILVQLLPTSPLITPEEVRQFVDEMARGDWDTLVSVANHQIACMFQGEPVNFTRMEPHKSSQSMIPVQSYASVLMAWKTRTFTGNMHRHGFAYHGADGRVGRFPLTGLSQIDIDHEEDFALAEVALMYRADSRKMTPQYYQEKALRPHS